MLTRLSIRNIVLIEALDLDFVRGLGVLTGETGAGKSILLDARGLVLGDRAETSLVRAGEDKASVTASFEFAALPAGIAAALDEAEIAIEPGEPLMIRRQVKADGGSKAFINDQPASVALLRELAPALVELHGQHDDRGLVNPRGHRALLDRYAGTDVAGLERAYADWARTEAQLAEARGSVEQAKADQDLLIAHLAELAALEPVAGEEARRTGVSHVAAGPGGFLEAYRRARGKPGALGYHATGESWRSRRNNFVARHMAQVLARREPLWTASGEPSRRHLALAVWAYSPTPRDFAAWAHETAAGY